MNTWILVLVYIAGYANAGISIDHIDFVSKEKCEEAQKVIRRMDRDATIPKHLLSVCVEK